MPVIAPKHWALRGDLTGFIPRKVGAAFIRVALHHKGAHLPILVGTSAMRPDSQI